PLRHASPGVCFYLDGESVMALYQQSGYNTALRHEVEEKIRSGTDAKISAEFHGTGGKAGRTNELEVFRKYIEIAEPITVIGIIMGVLEDAGAIVYADLSSNMLEPNEALDRVLRSMHGQDAGRASSLDLRDLETLDAFVSVKGRFQEFYKTEAGAPSATSDEDETVTLAAWYGDSPDPPLVPKISPICVVSMFRHRPVPSGPFQARCLGRVQAWNSNTR